MSTMFESAAYNLERSAPFASPQPMKFIAEKARWGGGLGNVIMRVKYRHDVASRLWWVLEWNEGNERVSVCASESGLLFWRAIQMHKQKERQRELENRPVSSGRIGRTFEMASINGWENGDGI